MGDLHEQGCVRLQTQDDLFKSILETSVRNNAKLAVTGTLIVHGQHFIQALEGPADGAEW